MERIRVTLSRDELSYIVGALRDRIDGYQEQAEEDIDEEMGSWLKESLAILVPLERRLTKRGGLAG